jgi:hypothetical protein
LPELAPVGVSAYWEAPDLGKKRMLADDVGVFLWFSLFLFRWIASETGWTFPEFFFVLRRYSQALR